MTDDDKKSPLDDFDWDSALAEWDKKPFEPEVAREKKPSDDKKPLYRPPQKTIDPTASQLAEPPAPPRPAAPIKPKAPPLKPKAPPLPPRPGPGRRGGGLGQLFSKPEPRKRTVEEEEADAIDVLLEEPPARKRFRAEDDDEGVVTSATDIETSDADVEERVGPSSVDSHDIGEGEMYDPFAEPAHLQNVPTVHPPPMEDPRPAQSTSPAPEEVALQPELAPEPEPAAAPRADAPAPDEGAPDLASTHEVVHESLAPDEPVVGEEPFPGVDLPPEEARVQSVTSEAEEVHEFEPPKLPSVAPQAVATIEDERPAPAWLDEETIAALRDRATWLEEEARNVVDRVGNAKLLLAVSEIRAIVGDVEEAGRLANEAKSLASHLPLAHRQARGLGGRDAGDIVASLDDELRSQPQPAAKLHATLYAAQAFAVQGETEDANRRYDQAARFAPTDARVVLARGLRALVKGELTNAALKIDPGVPELATLATAVGAVLRARGASTAAAPAGEGALDTLGRARDALEKGDLAGAVDRLGELAATRPGEGETEPVLARGARWLAAALGSVRAPTRRRAAEMLDALVKSGDELAARALAARGVELGEPETVARAVATGGAFSPADRIALAALLGYANEREEHDVAALMTDDASATLAAAVAERTDPTAAAAGGAESRAAARVGHSLAAGTADLEASADAAEAIDPALARALRIEAARLGGRHEEVVAALATWGDGGVQRALAAALVAERAELGPRAAASYRAALEADAEHEAAARAAAELEDAASLPGALRDLAGRAGDGVRAALLELEALLRAPEEDPAAELAALEKVHAFAPQLPFAPFLAQRAARRAGDEKAVVHWLRERQKTATDALERALDSVREAWLIADSDPEAASERVSEAHQSRPDDVALRELHERLAREPLADRATWREARADKATGPARDLLLVEAAYEHERSGDHAAALAAARAADREGKGSRLARIALERVELLAGDAARLADELLALARTAETPEARREAYERLADLDATARHDAGSALLWHRSILEETPAHKPSLRHVEHALLGARRDDELEPILGAVARALDGSGGECAAHAEVAARFRMRSGDWDGTREYAALGARQSSPTTWALRLHNAHARATEDDAALLESTLALLERATMPIEFATLATRAAEVAERAGDLERAETLAARATVEDAADVVAFRLLARIRAARGDAAGAGEAYESLARVVGTDPHRLHAWYAAGRAFDEAKDEARAIAAFEHAAALDVRHEDLFPRLSKLYAQKGARGELAALLERRIATVLDPEERVSLEVDRGRALAEAGDFAAAKEAYDAALAVQPDHIAALKASAELCDSQKDFEGAEQVWVRLARLLATPEEQLAAYRHLGDLYAEHLTNLPRAEVALREVLKRAPDDVQARERLVDVYKKQNDAARALEIQAELLAQAADPQAKRKRLVELASIHETASRDLRKAEQTLEAARREAPGDVSVLRALAEFYIRHKQTPAVNILLDRAAGDARRAFAAGRFSAQLFETMVAVYELRGKQDAAHVVAATLAAYNGEPSNLRGAEGRAFDPRLDELLAPEMLSAAARMLLSRTGQALDVATAWDLRALKAAPMAQGEPVARLAAAMAQSANLGGVQVHVSPQIGRRCVATGDVRSPSIVVGDAFAQVPEGARAFLILRAIKLMQVHGSAFARIAPAEVPVLVGAWLKAFAPNYAPPGVPPPALAEATRRLQGALPKSEPDLGLAALEVAGAVGPQLGLLGGSILAWANHAALLGVGDLGAALDGVACGMGARGDAPPSASERAAWITRTPEAKDLVAFSVGDGYTEARSRLGIR